MKKLYVLMFFALAFVSLLGIAGASSGSGGVGIMSVAPSAPISFPDDSLNYSIINHFNWSFNSGSGATIYNCSYTFDGGATLNLVNCSVGISNFGVLADGNHHLEFICDYSLGAHFGPSSLSGVDFFTDTIPPQFSNLIESPSPATYSPLQSYELNVTVTDSGIGVDSVWIEFDGINYTRTGSGGVYSFDVSDLGAGSYSYRWYANDSLGNVNETGLMTYTVNPADPRAGMSLVGSNPIIYGTLSNFVGMETNARDGGCSYDLSPANNVFGAGTVTFNYSTAGCQNYSAGSITVDLVISRAPQNAVLVLSPNSTITYGTNVNATCNGTLFRDDADVSAEIGQDVLLGAGSYNYSCKMFETQNYSFSELNSTFVVNQAAPVLSLIVTPADSVTSGTETNATGVCVPALNCSLFRDGLEVNNSDIGIFAVGSYNYTYNTTGNNNYTFAQVNATLNVNSAPSSGGGRGSSHSGSCGSNWTCSDWSECLASGTQERNCSLINPSCIASGAKPSEIQGCILPDLGGNNVNNTNESEVNSSGSIPTNLTEDNNAPAGGAGITGAAIGSGLSGGSWILIMIVIAGIAGAYGFTVWRKKQFRSSLERTLWQAADSKIDK